MGKSLLDVVQELWDMRNGLLASAIILVLTSCVPLATPASIEATPTLSGPVKPTGKLSARLEMLAHSPALRASAPDQARALGLPEQGPGSLRRDREGRILVSIRMSGLAQEQLQELRDAGAVVVNVSEAYRTVTAFVQPPDLTRLASLAAIESIKEELAPGAGGGFVPSPP
ncbi:MAG TPA: hypothetical protein VIX58_06095 [Anaerolineae bacterium]